MEALAVEEQFEVAVLLNREPEELLTNEKATAVIKSGSDENYITDITAWSKSMQSTPGLTACSNPRLSLSRPSSNEGEKNWWKKRDYLSTVDNVGGLRAGKTHLPRLFVNILVICLHAVCSRAHSPRLVAIEPSPLTRHDFSLGPVDIHTFCLITNVHRRLLLFLLSAARNHRFKHD